jgi:Holliday junction resolvasome RuvABC endonuclease subunit
VISSGPQALRALSGGVISTSAAEPLERRLAAIAARLEELLLEHRPDAGAI